MIVPENYFRLVLIFQNLLVFFKLPILQWYILKCWPKCTLESIWRIDRKPSRLCTTSIQTKMEIQSSTFSQICTIMSLFPWMQWFSAWYIFSFWYILIIFILQGTITLKSSDYLSLLHLLPVPQLHGTKIRKGTSCCCYTRPIVCTTHM